MLEIHKKIICARKLRQLSQLETAELSNISIRSYQRIESGEMSLRLDYLERIANALQCSVFEILYFDLETNQLPINDLSNRCQALEAENAQLRVILNEVLVELRMDVKM